MTKEKLIQSIKTQAVTSYCKGNTIWAVEETEDGKIIACYELNKEENGWMAVRCEEKDHPQSITCPLTYFRDIYPTCPQWRLEVYRRYEERQETVKNVKEMLSTVDDEHEIVITLEAKPGYYLNVDRLTVAKVSKGRIYGRCDNQRLYRIPTERIKSISLEKI